MASLVYWRLRWRIFAYEVKHWSRQAEQTFLLMVSFLGIALPAFFYAVLLAFGVVLNHSTPPLQTMIIVYAILIAQSLILQLFQHSIMGTRQKYFLKTVEPNSFIRIVSHCVLSFIANPLIGILLFILLSIEAINWVKIPHGFLLLSLQICLSWLALTHATKLKPLLLSFGLLIPLVFFFEIWLILLIAHCLILLVYYVPLSLPKAIMRIAEYLPYTLIFWLEVCKRQSASHNVSTVFIVLSFNSLIVLISFYSALNLPQYKAEVAYIGLQLLTLSCACVQLSINRFMREHALFLAQYKTHAAMIYGQYAPVLIIGLLTFCVYSLLLQGYIAAVLQMLALAICQFIAKRYSNYLIFTWLLMSGAMAILLI